MKRSPAKTYFTAFTSKLSVFSKTTPPIPNIIEPTKIVERHATVTTIFNHFAKNSHNQSTNLSSSSIFNPQPIE